MKSRFHIVIGAATSLLFATAFAHHTFSMFDFRKDVTLSGTVREFQWNNPHCFIQLLVPNEGAVQEWSIEMGSPMHLMRHGFKPKSFNPGDKVSVVIHPMRDGSNGGDFVSATSADGTSRGS